MNLAIYMLCIDSQDFVGLRLLLAGTFFDENTGRIRAHFRPVGMALSVIN